MNFKKTLVSRLGRGEPTASATSLVIDDPDETFRRAFFSRTSRVGRGADCEPDMDLNRWKRHHFKVSALELDPLNPRIPALVQAPTQRDIVAHLIEHEDVYNLTKSI